MNKHPFDEIHQYYYFAAKRKYYSLYIKKVRNPKKKIFIICTIHYQFMYLTFSLVVLY
jgi:hypothetical protein